MRTACWLLVFVLVHGSAGLACARDADPTEQRRAKRYSVTGRALTGVGIAQGIVAIAFGLGFGLSDRNVGGDHVYRDLAAIPGGLALGASALAFLAAGVPLWIIGDRRRALVVTATWTPASARLTF
jgi:hypothetical protein